MMQEKSMRSQAEQRSIELLQQRKDWEGGMESKDAEIAELKKKVEALEEKEKDLQLELKVGLRIGLDGTRR